MARASLLSRLTGRTALAQQVEQLAKLQEASREDFRLFVREIRERKKLDESLGYDDEVKPEDMRREYNRGGLVSSLVEARPDSTWNGESILTRDGAPSDELNDLARRYRLWTTMTQADLQAEITGYSVVVLTGPNLRARPAPVEARTMPLKVWGADRITWNESDLGPDGRPAVYQLNGVGNQTEVNADRCLHFADTRYSESILVGNPRLRRNWNLICDAKKAIGGGAEAFLQAVKPQYSANYTDIAPTEAELKADEERIEDFIEGRKRFVQAGIAELQRVAPVPVDFSANGQFMLMALAAAFRVPLSDFSGEALVSHSASTNLLSWHGRINERRWYIERELISPLVVWFESVLAGRGGNRGYEDEARIGVEWPPWPEEQEQDMSEAVDDVDDAAEEEDEGENDENGEDADEDDE